MSKGKNLKKLLHKKDEILILPGVYDGISAHVLSYFGFKAASVGGAGLSESVLGIPDVGVMGLRDNVDTVRKIGESSDLLLFADGDTGYGNAVNVYYTVKAFDSAGAAGVTIEDQTYPKRCGHMSGKEIISSEEMIYKIQAAVDARTDTDFVIKARTDSFAIGGIEEAVRRGNLYAEAGADIIFADALTSREDIEYFVKSVNAPVKVNMGYGIRKRKTTPLISPRELQELGVSCVSYPRMLTSAAMQGMMNALTVFKESLKDGTVIEKPELLVSFEEYNQIMGFQNIKDLEKRYSNDNIN